ncbi:hypothetical protein GCM10023225_20530 [Kineococcus glutinatus]|uniref:LGFP repeat-containing protein n=1 Tax=Kineococcus glutinatus TaxID=1070872 RepID=A0ABP9HW04_9ACTN
MAVAVAAAALTATAAPVQAAPTAFVQNADGSRSYGGYVVRGEILRCYVGLGAEQGFLGRPFSEESGPERGYGFRQSFQGGEVYWTPATGAHVVKGEILDEYRHENYNLGWLGYPVSDEIPVRGGVIQRFQGAVVYWSPATGAHPVRGAIMDRYAQDRWETGRLGFPTSGEQAVYGGAVQTFQGGDVYWSPATGAHAVVGGIKEVYDHFDGLDGNGFPLGEEYRTRTGWRQDFQDAYILFG